MKHRLVIVDSNAICHQIRFSMRNSPLTTEEQRTEIIFGFLRKILVYAKLLQTSDFAFAWDTLRNFRFEVYPNYKMNRHKSNKSDEDKKLDIITFPQFEALRTKVLPRMGFNNIFCHEGLEADDIIAKIVGNYPSLDKYIVSRDSDLFQLLSPHCSMVYNKDIFTMEDFYKKYEISPNKWAMVKAIAGCTTDNVLGVAGVGEKTACQFLNGTLKPKSKKAVSIEENQDIINRNLPLVKLPYKGTPVCRLKKDKLQWSDFEYVFVYLDFLSFIKNNNRRTEWKQFAERKW